jgi:thymidine phosphorylase
LYYGVPKALAALTRDRSQDLLEQFRRYNVQALMLAPQAQRNEAAEQLSAILREAARRKAGPDEKPRRAAP